VGFGQPKKQSKAGSGKKLRPVFLCGPLPPLLFAPPHQKSNSTKKKYNKKNLEFVRNGLEETWG
jgi:hypothetical protein